MLALEDFEDEILTTAMMEVVVLEFITEEVLVPVDAVLGLVFIGVMPSRSDISSLL